MEICLVSGKGVKGSIPCALEIERINQHHEDKVVGVLKDGWNEVVGFLIYPAIDGIDTLLRAEIHLVHLSVVIVGQQILITIVHMYKMGLRPQCVGRFHDRIFCVELLLSLFLRHTPVGIILKWRTVGKFADQLLVVLVHLLVGVRSGSHDFPYLRKRVAGGTILQHRDGNLCRKR